MFTLFAILTSLIVVATLVPLSRSPVWWVRGLDFPRLQLALPALALLVAGALLLGWSRPATWLLLAALAACLVYHAWWIFPYTRLHRVEVQRSAAIAADRRLRILSSNVLMHNRDARPLLEAVRVHAPDVLIALETDDWWQTQLDRLEPEYPYSLKRPLDNFYGMHLYSRLPLEDAEIQFLVGPDIPSMHTVVVLRSGERVRLHCLHPEPPTPTENPKSSERDAELIVVGRSVADAKLPVVVAGDLNDVAWSATTRLFRKISGLLDPRVGRGMFNTFHARLPLVRWPLDHLFHSDDFTLVDIRRLGYVGSDHFPILVELQLSSEADANAEAPEPDPEDHRRAEQITRHEGVDERDVHSPGE